MKKRTLSPKKTPRQDRSRATVEAILEATTHILIRDGYAKLTTNRIADRAGVNIASLYQYFPGKDAIVAELRRRHGAEARAALRPVLAAHRPGGLDSTLRALVSIGVAEHAQASRLHRVFTEEMPALGFRDVAAIDAATVDGMRRVLQDADVDVRDIDLALWMISTASGAILHRAAVERPEDLSNGVVAEELVTLLWRYLRKRPGPRRAANEDEPATVLETRRADRPESRVAPARRARTPRRDRRRSAPS